jgi:hypothetical protein
MVPNYWYVPGHTQRLTARATVHQRSLIIASQALSLLRCETLFEDAPENHTQPSQVRACPSEPGTF